VKITIPLYIEQRKKKGMPPLFAVRALFHRDYAEQNEKLSKALSRTTGRIRKKLNRLAHGTRHSSLAEWTYCPRMTSTRLTLNLHLRRRSARCRFLFVSFPGPGRTLALTPSLPDLWFDVTKGQGLHDRAHDVLQHHFRTLDREVGGARAQPEHYALQEKERAWVDTVEFTITPSYTAPPKTEHPLAGLFGERVLSGDEELDQCGRCISVLFPDELKRATLRDAEVDALGALLTAPDHRPVLLVGPAHVGKTTVIHEVAFRSARARRKPHAADKNMWLLSPQRLISGMSVVGQWENRLLAILKEITRRQHILYFDDLVGLLHAGVTCQSSLSVADILSSHMERRKFRVVAEITPQSLRILQERNRRFADQFYILPIKEPTERQNLGILIQAMRQLEAQRTCRFQVNALPTVLDLQRRYARHLAFPGKAAHMLEQLAIKYGDSDISRETVISEFQQKSGLSASFIDDRTKLVHDDLVQAIGQEVIGQDEAIGALADAVCIAKARLNDPDRPLGTFLFLGPTGVGKTQCAKSLAHTLFGSTDRLLRFDMNEYVSSTSVQRLTGTFGDPKGLLTSAVQQEPFCVVLLDEIEKAHPDAFDLLLQVLGEGRLTNAMGQTIDFTNTMVIMTSNLGTRQASARFGFTTGEVARDETFVQAARDHFRPEFFNRIDRIIPFGELTRQDIQQIAKGLIQDVLAREGLQRRKCMLKVEPRAMDVIVDAGFHPQLGARALKRAIEQRLTHPVATRLAGMKTQTPVLIRVYAEREHLKSEVQALTNAQVRPLPEERVDISDPMWLLDHTTARITEITAALPDPGFEHGVGTTDLTTEHYRYLSLRHLLNNLEKKCQDLQQHLNTKKTPAIRVDAFPPARRRRRRLRDYWSENPKYLGNLWAAEDVHAYFDDLAGDSLPYGQGLIGRMAGLIRKLCWVEAATEASSREQANRCVIIITPIMGQRCAEQVYLQEAYTQYFGHTGHEAVHLLSVGLRDQGIVPAHTEILLVERTAAWTEARIDQGTHLFFPTHGSLIPISVRVMALGPDADLNETVTQHMHESQKIEPVIRVYEQGGMTLDCRTGLLLKAQEELVPNLSVFIHSQLPIPHPLLEPHA
jgi:ATP-dependent Clp protease ATP-binding subunit ClpC